MKNKIPGVSRTALWAAWKTIRRSLRKSTIRDVIDYLEYDVNPDAWINRILFKLNNGNYEPSPPRRFQLAKSKGFSRWMTLPSMPDLVLYRAIVDSIYKRVKGTEHKHVYFEQSRLSQIQTRYASLALKKMKGKEPDYVPLSRQRFLAWLHYDQYRKFLINKVHPFIVTTDVTNFFDSILYDRLVESLYGISAPPKMVGLLFFILERLSIRDSYGESPRIGLPVDEFDCSRKLAHLVLFPHDNRMVETVTESRYVRWMDDQNIGAKSHSDALRIIAAVGESLSRLHLSPNTAKTHILNLRKAKLHFHFYANKHLDRLENFPFQTARQKKILRSEITKLWSKIKRNERIGEWDKILKRLYKMASRAQMKFFRQRALKDILEYPKLTERIATFMRCTGSTQQYIKFISYVWRHQDNPYGDVNLIVFSEALRIESDGSFSRKIMQLASKLLRKKIQIMGQDDCISIVPLVILRFGDKRNLPLLKRFFTKDANKYPPMVVRAAAFVYASYGRKEFFEVRRTASKLLNNYLADMVRMVEEIRNYVDVPERYANRLRPQFDPILNKVFIDMRGLLAIRLLALNTKKNVQLWLKDKKKSVLKEPISKFEKNLISKMI